MLNPLFLDDLRASLEAAGDSTRKLRALRRRIGAIRVFDPACGSGNFLVIAYIRLREIEHEIVQRTGDDSTSLIPLTNFYGIEIKGFPAEIARLALLIAEFQCDARLISQQAARSMVLPLHRTGQIHIGNALRMDWLAVCPPATRAVVEEHDLGGPMGRFALDDNGPGEAGEPEIYICGNPPYVGFTWQSLGQKADIRSVFVGKIPSTGFLYYVAGWFVKAIDLLANSRGAIAFVSTNSIAQGQSVPILWPIIIDAGFLISFAHTSFKWSNLANNKAGVTVAIVGLRKQAGPNICRLFSENDGDLECREGLSISPYLTIGPSTIVKKRDIPISHLDLMEFGNKPSDGGNLLLSLDDLHSLGLTKDQATRLTRRIYGSEDFINGRLRLCLWIEDSDLAYAQQIRTISDRIEAVRKVRLSSPDKGANALAKRAHQLKLMRIGSHHTIVVAAISSENREYLPVGLIGSESTITNKMYALYDASLANLSIIASRLHWVWIGTVCTRMRNDFSYSNTLGWNTFPVPLLTEQDLSDLTRCAESILLSRETHFPATIADLYDPKTMPEDLRRAHERNDETLERIYIGRRFRNDTERLEKLFDLYSRMTQAEHAGGHETSKKGRKAQAASASVA